MQKQSHFRYSLLEQDTIENVSKPMKNKKIILFSNFLRKMEKKLNFILCMQLFSADAGQIKPKSRMASRRFSQKTVTRI